MADSRIRYEADPVVASCYAVLRDGASLGTVYKVTTNLWGGTMADGTKLLDLYLTRDAVALEMESRQPGIGRREPSRLRQRILAKREAERIARGDER